ncbi:hypothetical protein Tco_0615120 [Tanacetum coccineum]
MDEAHASRLRWMIYLVVLADAAESVRDTIGFEYCLASSSGWTKSPVLWAEIGESSLIGPELVQETTDKVVLIKEKLKAARDRQKSYADNRRKPLEFEVGDRVMLKVSPWKGVIRFGKKGKLAPRYVGPFEILERIGPVAYRLRLPEELSGVHDTFHVSNLKKCLADASLHVPLDEIKVDKTLRFVEEPVEIMDREVKSLKRSRILLVKVHWNSKRGPEFTWEREDHMKSKYPQLFVDRAVESAMGFDSSAAFEHRFEKILLLTWHDSSEPTNELVCDSVTPRSLPQHDSSTPYLNLNEHVDLNVSQIETQYELPVSKEPDVGRTQVPIMEEVRTQEPIVEEGNGQKDELAPSDGHFFYDVKGIDSAYKTQYGIHSNKDAGTDDDDDDFLADEENEVVEPKVDVHLFSISMDVPFDNIGVTNLVLDDVLEGEDVDVINADGFDSNNGNDNKTSNYKRRRVRARCDEKVPVFTMSQGSGPTGPNQGIEVGPSGSSGPTNRSKKGRIQIPIMTVKHVLML